MRSLRPRAISTQRTTYVSGGQSDNISQVGRSCEPITVSVSDIRCTVGSKPGNMIYFGKKKYCKKVVPLGNQTLIELNRKVSTPVLWFHQKYHFLQSGKDYFLCLRYNLALNTETEHSAGNLRCANSRCSSYQEANSIWLVSELQRINPKCLQLNVRDMWNSDITQVNY